MDRVYIIGEKWVSWGKWVTGERGGTDRTIIISCVTFTLYYKSRVQCTWY